MRKNLRSAKGGFPGDLPERTLQTEYSYRKDSMTLNDLLQWWNLIFALPFMAALLQTLMQAMGVFHASHHLHIGSHGADGAHGLHAGHHLHLPGHHHELSHQEPTPGLVARMFSLLGLGKVPFMIILSSFCLLWGFIGVVLNQLLEPILRTPVVFLPVTIGVTFISTFALTGGLARIVGRLMPTTETYLTTEDDLVGRAGTSYTAINASGGTVAVLDTYNNRIELKCITENGSDIPRGMPVSIISYDDKRGRYLVRASRTSSSLESGSDRKQLTN